MREAEPVVPWTHVYGTARSLLAIATASTLAFNSNDVLWHAAETGTGGAACAAGFEQATLFCLLQPHLDQARWLAVVLLGLVATGWRPRVTGVLHAWVTHSYVSTALPIDGGDHLTSTLTLLLVPLTLTDARRWHWSAPEPYVSGSTLSNLRLALGKTTLWMLRLQVAVVYLNAAAAKWSVSEWADGTALSYWFRDPTYGFTEPLRWALGWTIESPLVLCFMTWSVFALEFSLFAAVFIRERTARTALLAIGCTFHLAIAFIHGLPTFGAIMIAALLLLLRREYEPLLGKDTAAFPPRVIALVTALRTAGRRWPRNWVRSQPAQTR